METVNDILREELESCKEDIIQRMADSGEYVSGDTASGFEVATENNSHGWIGGYSYVGVLEGGRKSGKVPVYFKEIIKRWILAKGLQYQDPKDLERMAASMAWVIHKEGTKLHRNGYKIDIFDTPVTNMMERLSKRISNYFTTETIKSI